MNALAHAYVETPEDTDPMNRIDWDSVECEAHCVAIDPARLDDPYGQKTLIGPSVVTGEIRYSKPVEKTPWPDMVI